MKQVSAAILVGGRAQRFAGRLKPALRVGDQTILERQLTALKQAAIDDVLAVGRWFEPRVAGVRHVPDVVEERGALGGLYSALLAATTPIVVVLAGDLPFVAPALIRLLARLDRNDEAIVPRTNDGWHPLCAGYRRTVATRIKPRLDRGALRLSDALEDMRVRPVEVEALEAIDPDGMLLMNVNTPDDQRDAERHARSRSVNGSSSDGGT